jgi:hypothetical protein
MMVAYFSLRCRPTQANDFNSPPSAEPARRFPAPQSNSLLSSLSKTSSLLPRRREHVAYSKTPSEFLKITLALRPVFGHFRALGIIWRQ